MPRTRWDDVIPQLLRNTNARDLEWYQTSTGRFALDIGDGSFHIFKDASDDVILQLRTSEGVTVDTIGQGDPETSDGELVGQMGQLFASARDRALKVDELWDSVLRDIGN